MAKVAFALGFENLGGGRYKTDAPITYGPTASAQSARLPVGPNEQLPTLTVIPTSTERPKPTNAVIPYARTCSEMIPVGEIVLAEGRPWENEVRMGSGSKNRSSNLVEVKTLQQVNELIKSEAAIPLRVVCYPSRNLDGTVNRGDWHNCKRAPSSVSRWIPDGVVISSEEGDVGSSARMCNVAVGGGPTPLLNLPERPTYTKKGDRVGMRVFVALLYDAAPPKQKYKFVALSKAVMMVPGFDYSKIMLIWPIGRLADLNLNTRERPGGSIVVGIDTVRFTRATITKNRYVVVPGTFVRERVQVQHQGLSLKQQLERL